MILISCRDPNGYPKINDIEQLSPYFEYVEIDGKQYIDVEKSGCLARAYRHSKGFIGSVSGTIILHISECHKVIGYAPKEYGTYTTWKENMRNWMLQQ
ncbi:MAG: hypothetical protein V2I33_07095 [Kangiellaceae bacterium]|jgi:hypothetical protein|nr:hypothetical protein [Kangiellaceae bacterium]